MLTLPTVGMRLSINQHNVELDALCDWLEGCVVFDGEEPSMSDAVDFLTENNIYRQQDFALEMVQNAWGQLERRQRWAGRGTAVEVTGPRLKPRDTWSEYPAHSFCLALAYSQWYPQWRDQFGRDSTQQGDLFEMLTKEALERILPNWLVHRTGWTPGSPVRLAEAAADVASRLGEELGDLAIWGGTQAHEEGLDLLCYRSLEDERAGVPVFLVQCASGKNWRDKLKTPDLEIWTKIVVFASRPKKAFSMPFALSNSTEFKRNCARVDGLLLDRCRLLSAGRTNPNWVSTNLKAEIVAWLEPRIAQLPRADY